MRTRGHRASARARASSCSTRSASLRPSRGLRAFPHQLSGGMSQRVMIAMAIACNPRLLIADEPTTALDVTIQAQILDLLLELQRQRGMALILITHDMAVVAETAQGVVGPVRRPAGRGAGRARPVRRPDAPLYRGAARSLAGARHPAPPAHDSGRGARRRRPPERLSVPPALPQRHQLLRGERAGARRRPARQGALPLPAHRRRAGAPSRLRGSAA